MLILNFASSIYIRLKSFFGTNFFDKLENNFLAYFKFSYKAKRLFTLIDLLVFCYFSIMLEDFLLCYK